MPEDPSASSPEADSRFLLANERTYLAYIRTSLALMVTGAAVANVDAFADSSLAGVPLLLLGVAVAIGGYLRWRSNDGRLRSGRPLRSTWFPFAMVAALAAIGLFVTVIAVV